MDPPPDLRSAQYITKADVPFVATYAGQIVLLVIVVAAFAAGPICFRLYPGVLEFAIGAAAGVPVGLLAAWRYVVLITRGVIKRKGKAEPWAFWQPLDPDWGWSILGGMAALLIFGLAAALDYWAYLASPRLSMPWARFAPVEFFHGGGIVYFPYESFIAMYASAWLVGHLVAAIRLMQWYASLPPPQSPRPRGIDGG